MALSDSRWMELGDPASPAEADALRALRELLADSPVTHAWSNVTFRDRNGRASEIDVLLLHRNGLFVLELKGWHGAIRGDQLTWRVTDPNGRVRVERDPFLATDGKAKRLASELKRAAAVRGGRRVLVPRVEAVTIMHGQGSRLDLSQAAAATTFGLDGYGVTGVASIRELLDEPPSDVANDIDAARARALVALIRGMGLQPTPKVQVVGQYVIDDADPLGEGPDWVDVRARHPVLRGEHRRIRMYDVPPRASAPQRREIERMALREYALAKALEHPGVVRPLEVLTPEAGPALVFPDDSEMVPLGRYLADRALDSDARRALIRQIGEIVGYAHAQAAHCAAAQPQVPDTRQRGYPVGLLLRPQEVPLPSGPPGAGERSGEPGPFTLPAQSRQRRHNGRPHRAVA